MGRRAASSKGKHRGSRSKSVLKDRVDPEDLIYIRVEHGEARATRELLLQSQMGLLKTSRAIQNYARLRSEELEKKIILKRNLKELQSLLKELQTTLPPLKIPKILQEHEKHLHHHEVTYTHSLPEERPMEPKPMHQSRIDRELESIETRLNALRGRE